MSNGMNKPYGLIPVRHRLGDIDNPAFSHNYIISPGSVTLNKGDPVKLEENVANYTAKNLKYPLIELYQPIITLGLATGTISTSNMAGSSNAATGAIMPRGVFKSCTYTTPKGELVEEDHWIPGTATNGDPVVATIWDDPYIEYKIQLGTYVGSLLANPNLFAVLPCMQIQNASWPNTGGALDANPLASRSALVGSNITLCTGSAPATAGGSLSTILRRTDPTTANPAGATVVANYANNPLIANYSNTLLTDARNPYGVSTFYACPSLAVTQTGIVDARVEYNRGGSELGELRVSGFAEGSTNLPTTYGYPATVATNGTYYNTPFLDVLVTINRHVDKASTSPIYGA